MGDYGKVDERHTVLDLLEIPKKKRKLLSTSSNSVDKLKYGGWSQFRMSQNML